MTTQDPNHPNVQRDDDNGQLGGPKAGGFDDLGTDKKAEPQDRSGN